MSVSIPRTLVQPGMGRARSGGLSPTVALSLPAIVFMIVCYGYPLGQMLVLSLFDPRFTVTHYARVLRTAGYVRVIVNTFEVSAIATAICLVVGYPLAYVLARASSRVVNVLLLILALPFLTSILVRTYGWMILLQRTGLVNTGLRALGLVSEPVPLMYNRIGVIIGMVHILLPYMVLPLFSAMRGIDWDLLRVAHVLGATPGAAFWRIFVPLTRPGIQAGCLLVFISGLGFFVTPALLGGLRDIMIAMVIQTQVEAVGNWAFSAALATVLLLMTLGVLGLVQWRHRLGRVGQHWRPGAHRGTGVARQWRWTVRQQARRLLHVGPGVQAVGAALAKLATRDRPLVLYLVCGLIVVFLLAPLGVIIPISFSKARFLNFPPPGYSWQWYRLLLSSREWSEALATSLRVGLTATALALLLGTPAAYSYVRGRMRMRRVVYGFLLSPMIVPHIAIAIAMYFAFRRLEIAGSVVGLVLGHTVIALPFVFIIMVSTFESSDESLEHAAASLGATPLQRWRRVVLPLVTPGLVGGAILGFMASFDEVIIALFLSGTRTMTLPRKLWNEVAQSEPSPVVAAVSTVLIAISVVALVGLEVLRRRSNGRVGLFAGHSGRSRLAAGG